MPPTSSRVHKFQWADVSQKPDFVAFAEGIVTRLGEKIIQPGDINLVVNQLIKFLNQQPCLLVVDNLETLLTETEDWQDSGYEKFFSRWIQYQHEHNSTILLTTREQPNLFRVWEYWYPLEGLKPKKGAQLLQELKIKATEAELEAFSQSVDGHPLTLRLVAGFLREYCGGEWSRVDELGLPQEELIFEEAEGQHHERTNARLSWILDQHLQRLTDQEKRFLFNLTVYRQPFDSKAAVWMWEEENERDRDRGERPFAPTIKPFRILKELAALRNRSLLLEIGGNRFQFQFLIQRYLQQILVRQYAQQGTDFTFAHQQALKYYRSHLKPEPWGSLDDVSEYLEACYHHCQLQQYAQAYEMAERCHTFLDLRGDYQKLVEMYGTLAQEWQPKSPEDKTNWGEAWIHLGFAYHLLNKYEEGIECQLRANQIFCEVVDPRGEAKSLYYLGNTYTSKGSYEDAVKFHKKALKIAKKIDDKKEKEKIFAAIFGSLGFTYSRKGDYKIGIKYSRHSLKIKQKIKDLRGEIYSLGDLGYAYFSLGDYQQAIELYQQSLPITRKIGDLFGAAFTLIGLGKAYNSLGQYTEARDYYQQSLDLAKEINYRQGEADASFHLGLVLAKLNCTSEAVTALQNARQLYQEMGLDAKVQECDSEIGKADK